MHRRDLRRLRCWQCSRVLPRLDSSVADLKYLLLVAPEVTDFWGKADISPGVRQNAGLVRVIPWSVCQGSWVVLQAEDKPPY